MEQARIATADQCEINEDHNGWLTLLDMRLTAAENNVVAGSLFGFLVASFVFLVVMGANALRDMNFNKAVSNGAAVGTFAGFLVFCATVVLRNPNSASTKLVKQLADMRAAQVSAADDGSQPVDIPEVEAAIA